MNAYATNDSGNTKHQHQQRAQVEHEVDPRKPGRKLVRGHSLGEDALEQVVAQGERDRRQNHEQRNSTRIRVADDVGQTREQAGTTLLDLGAGGCRDFIR